MRVKIIKLFIILFFIANQFIFTNQDKFFIDIKTSIDPGIVTLGEEGVLKIKISASSLVRISSFPEFVIRLNDSESGIKFTKNFFTASELDFKTKQDGDNFFLDLEKEILIPFKIDVESHVKDHKISGNIVFTAVEKKDNWSVKTFQNFSTNYFKSKIKKQRKKRVTKIKREK